MNQTRIGRKNKKKSPLKRVLKIIISALVLLTIIGAGYGVYLGYTIKEVANDSFEELDRGEKSELRIEKVTLKKDPVTILLVGVDDYVKDDKGRADVILLLTLNPVTKEMAMLSIPRDTRTYIPSVERKDKINHSYSYDDIEGTVETVQEFLGIPVDYYIKTGVTGFQDVVDELGGVTVNVPFDFNQVDLKNRKIYFNKGVMDLDGREALAFVQMRYQDPEGDFGRQKRQQEVLNAIAKRAISFNSIPKANSIIRTVGSNIETNLKLDELLGLRTFYEELTNKEFTRLSLEGEGQTINGGWYFIPSQESMDNVETELKRILNLSDTNSNVLNTASEKYFEDEQQQHY